MLNDQPDWLPVSFFPQRALATLASETSTKPFVIRTTDRMQFRRCRRKWFWQSHMFDQRVPKAPQEPLWFGIGIHYALDDYHGHNIYQHPARAWQAYVHGCRQAARLNDGGLKDHILVPTWKEYLDLGTLMMEYYADTWLKNRDPLTTYLHNGVPQCEVDFEIPLPIDNGTGRPVVYRGRLDRVSIDEYGRLWIVEYKTAAAFRLYHFDTDDQINAYCWACYVLYGRPVAGVVYMQFKKDFPKPPRVLANGKLSTDKRQPTTHGLYRQALKDMYGDPNLAPMANIQMLNYLVDFESIDGDKFIRRDMIERNMHQIQAEGVKILMEATDMVNPDLPLYPNPNKDCGWDCPMQAACVAMDSGDDHEGILNDITAKREGYEEAWNKYLPQPQELEPYKVDPWVVNLENLQIDLDPRPPSLAKEEA